MDFNEIMDIVYPQKRKIFKKDSHKYDLGPEYASLKSRADGRNEAYANYLLKTFPQLENQFDELYDITYPQTRKSKTLKNHWLKENGYIKTKPLSEYNKFVQHNYRLVKTKYPSASMGEIMKKLGQYWRGEKDSEIIDQNPLPKPVPKAPQRQLIILPPKKYLKKIHTNMI